VDCFRFADDLVLNVVYIRWQFGAQIEIPDRWRKYIMRPFCLAVVIAAGIAMSASIGLAQHDSTAGPYKVLKTVKAGGEGGFDYISADVEGRRLYVPRNGPMGQLMVFNLDTLEPAGSIAGVKSGGAAVDPKSHHGFSTTKPITMWDSKTLQVIKTINVDGQPDGIMFDRFNDRVWVLSHMPPYATVIDAKEGTVVGTIDLGGQPEQAASDGKGTVYVNILDKSNIAVVDAKNLTVTKHLDLSSKGVMAGSGLSLDAKNHVLFSYWRLPSPVVLIVNAENGNIITSIPTAVNVDTVAFNPATMEAISTAGAGSIVFVKENSPTSFEVEQRLQTMVGARNMVLDTKTNHVLSMAFEYGPLPADAPPPVPGRMALGPPLPGSFTLLMVGK
jgi:DNA-binding beta-propeller fold protein YncE